MHVLNLIAIYMHLHFKGYIQKAANYANQNEKKKDEVTVTQLE